MSALSNLLKKAWRAWLGLDDTTSPFEPIDPARHQGARAWLR